MYATPKDLVSAFRTQARDTVAPYLWSDAEIYQYMTQAEAFVAQRLECLQDTSSAAAVFDVVAGESEITLHPSTIRIQAAYLLSDGEQRNLQLRTMAGMRNEKIFVETGTPSILIVGGVTGKARLFPIPDAASTLQLVLTRTPLTALTASSTKFEIPYHYTPAIFAWVCYRAYSKMDAETFDNAHASASMNEFEMLIDQYLSSEAGKTGSIRDGTIAYGGI